MNWFCGGHWVLTKRIWGDYPGNLLPLKPRVVKASSVKVRWPTPAFHLEDLLLVNSKRIYREAELGVETRKLDFVLIIKLELGKMSRK